MPSLYLFWSDNHLRSSDLYFFDWSVVRVCSGIAYAESVLEAFVIGCFAEDRVLAGKVRDSAHADEELRAGRVRVGRPSHRKNT